MIGYLRGKVTYLFSDHCFIDVEGVGYRVYIAASTRQKLAIGSAVTLFTYMDVRQDAIILFGFYSQEEYNLFLNLNSVTGIGPKVALGILSAISPIDFCAAVRKKNTAFLTRIPGIGKKTAERIILELKDKLGIDDLESGDFDESKQDYRQNDDTAAQAIAALVTLGYSAAEIAPTVHRLANCSQAVEEVIRLALKEFGGGKNG